MWPKRKIQLVASSAAPGINGVRALLQGMQLEFSEVEPTTEDLSEVFSDNWLEKPFSSQDKSGEETPVTEVAYWPGVLENDFWRRKALSLGIDQQPIQSLIHNILRDEKVLWITEPTVLFKGRPLLGHILEMAGFEPTLLWPIDGEWQCERKQGLHWLIAETWLEGLSAAEEFGSKKEIAGNKHITWAVRDAQIDFYSSSGRHTYLGHVSRWPEPAEEHEVCQAIAQSLDLGVSWLDIMLALNFSEKNNVRVNNMRWEFDDFGRHDGTCGEKIPAEPTKHLENWWAS